jgi:multidrug efflux pump subunit AcrA (membrane-fusion protein)
MSIDSSPPEATRPKRRLTQILGFAALVLLLLLLGIVPRLERRSAAVAQARSVEDEVPIVSTSQAKAAPPSSELLLPGNTQAVTVAAVYARSSGYVSKRLVDIGSKVKAGQLLAVIESPEVDQELAQAKANAEQARAGLEQAKATLQQSDAGLNQAKANLEQANANQEISRLSYTRWDRLVTRGVVSKQAADERRTDFSAKQAEVAASEASIHTAEANIVAQRSKPMCEGWRRCADSNEWSRRSMASSRNGKSNEAIWSPRAAAATGIFFLSLSRKRCGSR